jgi:hypothetical protein
MAVAYTPQTCVEILAGSIPVLGTTPSSFEERKVDWQSSGQKIRVSAVQFVQRKRLTHSPLVCKSCSLHQL